MNHVLVISSVLEFVKWQNYGIFMEGKGVCTTDATADQMYTSSLATHHYSKILTSLHHHHHHHHHQHHKLSSSGSEGWHAMLQSSPLTSILSQSFNVFISIHRCPLHDIIQPHSSWSSFTGVHCLTSSSRTHPGLHKYSPVSIAWHHPATLVLVFISIHRCPLLDII